MNNKLLDNFLSLARVFNIRLSRLRDKIFVVQSLVLFFSTRLKGDILIGSLTNYTAIDQDSLLSPGVVSHILIFSLRLSLPNLYPPIYKLQYNLLLHIQNYNLFLV